MNVTVYSKPRCVQCDATKRALNKAGITYKLVDITEDAAARERIMSLGYLQAPWSSPGRTTGRGTAPRS